MSDEAIDLPPLDLAIGELVRGLRVDANRHGARAFRNWMEHAKGSDQ